VHLIGFITRIYQNARSSERQIRRCEYLDGVFFKFNVIFQPPLKIQLEIKLCGLIDTANKQTIKQVVN
jgi:hypothetical protein